MALTRKGGEKTIKSKNWADDEEDDLEENDTGTHGSGVFERVSLHTNPKGQKVNLGTWFGS